MDPIRALKDHNPFFSSSSSKPWDNQFPDVTSINRDAFEGVMRLINEKSQHPRDPLAGIVFGETGFGKTHLIHRILLAVKDRNLNVSVVYIDPIINHNKAIRYLLRAVISDLSRKLPHNPQYNHFHELITRMIVDYLENYKRLDRQSIDRLRQNPYHLFQMTYEGQPILNFLGKLVIDQICIDIPEISRRFLKVLFQIHDPGKYGITVAWMKGEILDEEDCQRINVPGRQNFGEQALEEESREFLFSLSLLMERYQQTILVCFDQLENLKTIEQKNAFGSMVFTLCNEVFRILPIAFTRTLTWQELIKPKIDAAVSRRLESNSLDLTGCTLSDADEIIKKRIQLYFKDQWEEPYLWVKNALTGKIKEGYNPGMVIRLANQAIEGRISSPENPLKVLSDQYQAECDLVIANINSWMPDDDTLKYALIEFLSHQSSTTDIEIKKVGRINLVTKIRKAKDLEQTFSFIINTREHHSSIGSCFAEGVDYLIKNPNAGCYYITDPRCLVSRQSWTSTNKKRDEFIKAGGRILQLNIEEISRWYALTSLVFKIPEGAIQIVDSGGILRPITEDELHQFIGDENFFGNPLIPYEEPSTLKDGGHIDIIQPKIDEKEICDMIQNILCKSIMRILSTGVIRDNLVQNGYDISHSKILEICGKKSEVFIVYPTEKGSQISLQTTCVT